MSYFTHSRESNCHLVDLKNVREKMVVIFNNVTSVSEVLEKSNSIIDMMMHVWHALAIHYSSFGQIGIGKNNSPTFLWFMFAARQMNAKRRWRTCLRIIKARFSLCQSLGTAIMKTRRGAEVPINRLMRRSTARRILRDTG